MTARRQRIIFILLGLAGLALASYLILNALGNNPVSYTHLTLPTILLV